MTGGTASNTEGGTSGSAGEAKRQAGNGSSGPVSPSVRLPRLTPEELTPDQDTLYRTIVGGPRQQHASFFPVADEEGVLSGPYRAMLLSPGVGTALERLGVAVRYRSELPLWARELAILTVAVHTDCPVEWRAHEELARSSGVPEETIRSLHTETPVLSGQEARAVYGFVTGLLRENRVAESTFREVEALWSTAGVFELVVTAGYYQIIAFVNNAFEV
ncbi:4-carboxymuconolactone decarboxylase [Streptomyces sp. Amel2xB2]|uniref:carboxymuconolactone decarboxylase family protein n=1 Tax=Streptomyces sp. Amel2xB2 TaxID=1305829 RepID=UPI000DBA989B|nr:carboxymuconolactone decarboxylase family protein [Streptomyces sp. Amel2xB2]RAJ56571.1 4-carboxymuconolactone decarboxylase [Streptomyces sp. Amel2xB2]